MTTNTNTDPAMVHLFEHDEFTGGAEDPTCEHCAVRPLLRKLHMVYMSGNARMVADIYALNDAYGPVGTVPPQGYDWSGIRDSSPAAIRAMVQAVTV